MNFTGQHRCKCISKNPKPGMVLVATGGYHNMDALPVDSPSINESLPIVKVCDTPKCKAVFGVYSESEDPNLREFASGSFVSVYDKDPNDSRVFVNSLGEGAILVCDSNGNIINGDYLTSFRRGYAQKQDSEFLANYTVAKATQGVDFSNVSEKFMLNGRRYKYALVGCTYHCG